MTKQIFHHESKSIHNLGRRIVCAEDLIAAGWLIEAGYAVAEDDYEGPVIWLTKSGKNLAEKKIRNNTQGALKR